MHSGIIHFNQLCGTGHFLVGKSRVVHSMHPVHKPGTPFPEIMQCRILAKQVVALPSNAFFENLKVCIPTMFALANGDQATQIITHQFLVINIYTPLFFASIPECSEPAPRNHDVELSTAYVMTNVRCDDDHGFSFHHSMGRFYIIVAGASIKIELKAFSTQVTFTAAWYCGITVGEIFADCEWNMAIAGIGDASLAAALGGLVPSGPFIPLLDIAWYFIKTAAVAIGTEMLCIEWG